MATLPPRFCTMLRQVVPNLYICHRCRLLPHSALLWRKSGPVRALATHANKRKESHSDPIPVVLPTIDHRNRLSALFIPTGGITVGKEKDEDVHALLTRAGFLRQAYSGIFHLLPLGLRVQDKIEVLIDKHMRAVGASKLALSTISSEALWSKSGRLERVGQELIRFKDRKDTKYLLSPTHEEEITTLVSSIVTSYRQLPLRLYQISRKYRDERRPRAGLLRGREFTMKDLYTFDYDDKTAISTYYDICNQYRAIFEELRIPYILAEADNGNMGGSLSHEFHYPSPSGEDVVISCTSCNYAANEICAKSPPPRPSNTLKPEVAVFHGITKDRKTLINVFYPKHRVPAIDQKKNIQDAEKHLDPRRHEGAIHLNKVNPHRVKELVPDYDPTIHSPLRLFWQRFTKYNHSISHISVDPMAAAGPERYSSIINIYDYRLSSLPDIDNFAALGQQETSSVSKDIPTTTIGNLTDPDAEPINIVKICDGDLCPRCSSGSLAVTNAIELGHTFHLGSRYTVPLNATVSSPMEGDEGKLVPMSMGCHGIGVSRIIAAIAEGFRDEKGLMWPRAIAPFEICIIGTKGEGMEDIYDILTSENASEGGMGAGTSPRTLDVVLDDRDKSLVWKLNDADLIGYPVLLVLGRKWKSDGKVEVQCRSKSWSGENKSMIVEVSEVKKIVGELLSEL